MSNGTYNSSPGSTPGSEEPTFHTPEEKKRMEASEREAAAKGETKWYLSVQQAPKPTEQSPLRIISTGYGALDSGKGAQYSDSEDDTPQTKDAPGRMNFGNFNRKQAVSLRAGILHTGPGDLQFMAETTGRLRIFGRKLIGIGI
jgi:hypothetical protein